MGLDDLPFTRSTYLEYQKSNQSKRKMLIKEMYNRYPMILSWVYAGHERGSFRLKEVYEDFGFIFKEYDTTMVQQNYTHRVNPNMEEPKTFLIGIRKWNEKVQYAILTPFLSYHRINNKDIDVITTWADAILKGTYTAL
ncbi:hypothetical protein [Bacillus sp. B1-b2]|uniref:hypothetical protein n=1 Tax=Bacillus sp. B1-b2 TaxID=2653201 RepID=UPI00126159EB|nr:hypothetical protein [Bacillus sp. B1-b2]KAB7671673.1 hypothetical protein F9279_04955 [Bacillus sp. B1-b2]